MPVERQHGLLINRSRECCATHRVVMTHTDIIEKQKKIECYTDIPLHYVQLVVYSWPRSNIRSIIQFTRTSLWYFSRTTDVTVNFHLFTSNSKIRCWPKITCYINILYMGYPCRKIRSGRWSAQARNVGSQCWLSILDRWSIEAWMIITGLYWLVILAPKSLPMIGRESLPELSRRSFKFIKILIMTIKFKT